jgi:hypothetical protein
MRQRSSIMHSDHQTRSERPRSRVESMAAAQAPNPPRRLASHPSAWLWPRFDGGRGVVGFHLYARDKGIPARTHRPGLRQIVNGMLVVVAPTTRNARSQLRGGR